MSRHEIAQSHPDPGPEDHPSASPNQETNNIQPNDDIISNLEDIEGCEECQTVQKNKLSQSCPDCGEPSREEDLQMCHMGLDAIALFPSMQDKNTGEIVRRRSIRSTLKMPSFDIKEGGRYILMNQHLTGPLGKLRRVLPRMRKIQGKMPGMTNQDLNSREGNIDMQWVFPEAKPTEAERK